MTDQDYMRRALDLARKGQGRTSPNPMVGAVLVKGGRIVGEGWHRQCGGPHAEVYALRQAGPRAKDAALYVTLEPCFHTGRTPPCVDAVIAAGVKTVVIGMKDPNPKTCGRSIVKLRRAGIRVTVGVLEPELRALNAAFVKYITTGRPWVVTKTAATLDGRIATAAGQSQWITSATARAWAHQRRDEFDAILIGINTVLADNPGLNGVRKDKRLKKVILDSTLRLPRTARLLAGTAPEDCWVMTTSRAPKARVTYWQKRGLRVCVAPGAADITWPWVLKELGRGEVTSVFVEGGAHVAGSALAARVVDRVMWFVAPKIFGEQNALGAVQGLRAPSAAGAVQLQDVQIQPVGDDLLIEAVPVYGKR